METLYFPHLSLPASAWVNPALLFFDRIDVIAPDDGGRELFDERTEALIREGMVRPIHPFRYHWDSQDDDRFISYLYGLTHSPPRVGGVERLHFRKIAHTALGHELLRAGMLEHVEGDWLEGPRWVCAHVMAYLALQLSSHPELQIPLVTDEDSAQRMMVGQARRRNPGSRASRVLRALLPVPASATVSEIADFKDQHRQELLQFRDFVDALITRDDLDTVADGQLEERISEAIRLREHLENEISSAVWRRTAVNISLSATAAVAPALESSYFSMTAGLLALINLGAEAVRTGRRRRRARRSPVVYAALASQRWRPRNTDDVFR